MSEGRIVLPNAVFLGEVKKILAEGRDVVILTKGFSMLPFIRGEKDSVRLRRLDAVEAGDIVLAEVRKDFYVLHRVVSVDGDNVVLKGDGNLSGTESCRLKDGCGTAVAIVLPSEKERDCHGESSKKRARRWNALPYIVKRLYLGIYKRLI